MTSEKNQDIAVNEVLDQSRAIFQNPFAFRRIWGHLDEVILQHHIYNALIVYKPEDNIDIVDLGCGTGELLYSLRKYYKNARCYGVDYNERSIEEAKRLGGSELYFIRGSYTDIFTVIQKADLVICSEVFEHVEDYHDLLKALSNLVKPEGYLSISTPSGWMWRVPNYLSLYKLLKFPKEFYQLYLTPENHWKKALAIHPAILPKKLIKLLGQYQFSTKLRRSSCWRMNETGINYKLFAHFAQKYPLKAPMIFESYFRLLEGLLNIIPIFRVFETRFILLAQKNKL
jgi:2-polyprenyl-3-methyl-5-hydroxy-6-metoxy-1,4-benzoquinol methylase